MSTHLKERYTGENILSCTRYNCNSSVDQWTKKNSSSLSSLEVPRPRSGENGLRL